MEANLQEANLSNADFSEADFSLVKAYSSNFSQSNLGDVLIEDWQINNQTQFKQVICNRLFLKHHETINSDSICFAETQDFINFINNHVHQV